MNRTYDFNMLSKLCIDLFGCISARGTVNLKQSLISYCSSIQSKASGSKAKKKKQIMMDIM